MTQYEIKTTQTEADEIASGAKDFIFRNNMNLVARGDFLNFRVIRDGKPMRHKIDIMKFKVTYISDEAPIEQGYTVFGFRRVS